MKRIQTIILSLILAASAASAADPSRLMLGQGQMAGRVTETSVILQSRLTAGSILVDGDLPGLPGVARFEIATTDNFQSSRKTPWLEALPENDYIVKTAVTSLKPATRYFYRLVYGPTKDEMTSGNTCTFRTLGGKNEVRRTRFAVVTGMNYFFFHEGAYKPETAYTGPDKHLGYPALESILKLKPDFFVGTGDTVYFDHPEKRGDRWTGTAWSDRARTEAEMRRKYHEQFRQPRFLDLFAQVPTYWEIDDHEYRYNDCDNTGDKLPSPALGAKNYREQLPVTDPNDPHALTYSTHRVSRDLQIWIVEGRLYRSPNAMPDGPEKTIWGARQKQWLKDTLLASDATFKILISPTPLVGPDGNGKRDNHANIRGFRQEGDAFFKWLAENGFLDKNFHILCGDRHWQYHAIHPTGFQEFSCGSIVGANSRKGVKAGDPKSTDPEGKIKQPYCVLEQDPYPGFLMVDIVPAGTAVRAEFVFHDENGKEVYKHTALATKKTDQRSYSSVERFGLFQAEFKAQKKSQNPYADLEGEAIFTTPDGGTWKVPLFWDGGVSWKLRLSPDRVGQWTFRVRSSDAGLNGREGVFECRASKRKGGIEPMEGYPNHFQYQNGDPFWFLGDTAWALYTDSEENDLDRKQVEHYMDTRAKQGFNVMHSMLMSEAGWGNQNGPPFFDMRTGKINPAYWREVDSRLAYLNSRGITGGLALAWGDKRKSEPFAWRRFPNVEARKRYARYIAARYGAYDVYFLVSGEWHGEVRTRSGVSEESIFREFVEIGDVLAENDPHGRMIGIHPMTRKGSVREFAAAAWMSFGDYQQNYRDLHRRALLSQKIGLPVVNSEYGYYLRDMDGDGKTDKSNSFSADDMRHSSWDIATAGGYFITGFGTTYFGGNRDPGPFDVDAKKNDDWESQVQYVKKFFEGIKWWKLIPADELISSPSPRTDDKVTRVRRGSGRADAIHPPERTYWAMTIPGETYVLYCRGLDEEVSLEFDSRKGGFRSRIYNPRSGKFTKSKNMDLSTKYTFKPPDNQDWVVLLERLDRKGN